MDKEKNELTNSTEISQQYEQLKIKFEKVFEQAASVIVGQKKLMQLISTAILANGHCLITGAPGLAKTLTVRTLSRLFDLTNKRIQCTPDLIPGDILGYEILDLDENGKKNMRYIQGPIFTNLLLADEINRATPRTQSALLEAMQELTVTVHGQHFELTKPFIVFATRNPIDSEGVYPLPEAQLDRFLLEIVIDYPEIEDELKIATMKTDVHLNALEPIVSKQDIISFQKLVDSVPIPENVLKSAVEWVRKTRPVNNPDIADWISWGAGPRATHHLMRAGRAYALLFGEGVVTKDIIRAVYPSVMRHRIVSSSFLKRSGKEINEILEQITIN